MSYYNVYWERWKPSVCIVSAIRRLWKSLSNTICVFSLFLSIIDVHPACLLLCNISKCCFKCSTALSTWYFHDFHFHSFEHIFSHHCDSIHPWFTSFLPFFFFSLPLAPISQHGLFHDALYGYSYWPLLLSYIIVRATKGESLPNLDCLLPPSLPQIPVNEAVRLAPVPAWRKVKSGTALPYTHRD